MKILLSFLLVSVSVAAQTSARVTIYTPGGWMKGAARSGITMGIGEHQTLSQGQLFDGDKKLATMFPGRFVTFELTPGNHEIATTLPEGKSRSAESIAAKPGEHYFLRLTTTTKGVWVIQNVTSHLESVSCDIARKEADATKPIQAKHIEKEARVQVVDATYFPRCE